MVYVVTLTTTDTWEHEKQTISAFYFGHINYSLRRTHLSLERASYKGRRCVCDTGREEEALRFQIGIHRLVQGNVLCDNWRGGVHLDQSGESCKTYF